MKANGETNGWTLLFQLYVIDSVRQCSWAVAVFVNGRVVVNTAVKSD